MNNSFHHGTPLRAPPLCVKGVTRAPALMLFLLAVLAIFAVPLACTSDPLPRMVQFAGCQPLYGPPECMVPYPSDYFRRPDARGGFVVKQDELASFATARGEKLDFTRDYPSDGFSITPSIVGALAGPLARDGLPSLVDAENLPDAQGQAKSTKLSSATLLLDARSGKLIAHYTDVREPNDRGYSAVVIRPVGPLEPNTRYLVALRGVRRQDGGLASTPEGFRRLRDGQVGGAGEGQSDDPELLTVRDTYEEIFSRWQTAGVPRGELQLAWSFTTGSHEAATRDMFRVRALTLDWLTREEPRVSRVVVTTLPSPGYKAVSGVIRGPAFVDGPNPGARLVRDASGQIAQRGETEIEFVVAIPESVRRQTAPARAVQYGHGFFGNLAEVTADYTMRIAEGLGAVMVATPWIGMATDDAVKVAGDLLGPISNAPRLTDRVHQAMANWLVLSRALRTTLRDVPELRRAESESTPATRDALFYDDTKLGTYLGISQGHILGATMSALNPEIDRTVLHVGGAGLAYMMPRARPFQALLALIKTSLQDPLNVELAVAMLAGPLERIEPAVYARHLVAEPLPGDPGDRRALLQFGLGDASVPNLGSIAHLLALRAPLTGPEVPGVPRQIPSGATDAKLAGTFWDFGVATAGYAEGPLNENPVHGQLRGSADALAQMRAFYETGLVRHPCEGVCSARLR